jgi:CubicO group peptidase (beta-lactamase class C family)
MKACNPTTPEHAAPKPWCVLALLGWAVAATAAGQTAAPARSPSKADEARQAMLARAKSMELPTAYVPPPGDALSHHTSGFAKVMCSAVFITGLDPEFAAENVGYFAAPYAERKKVGKPVVDRAAKTVSITLPSGVVRTAVYTGGQGCVTYPEGKNELFFKPIEVRSILPDPSTQPWPMGDVLDASPLPKEIDRAKLESAVEAAFDPAGMTAAFIVTYKGRLIAERYGTGITQTTPLESWSMGKSLTGTLLARLIHQGAYKLWDPAPIPEWQKTPGDPRAAIRIGDIMRMSSGLRIRAPQDPDYDPAAGYPDHLYLYTGGANSYEYAATRPLQWPPNTIGRYRNTDPVLAGYLVRLAALKRGEDYLSFPRRALLDKLGMRTMVMETDPYGNFLTQGYELASARDWARLGNLYLQDGVWNGERLLPEGYALYARTVAPAWQTDGRPIYGGGFFWVNGDGADPVPRSAFSMRGAGGQTTMIIPTHDLVVVRLGHYKGEEAGDRALDRALALLVEAVPSHP